MELELTRVDYYSVNPVVVNCMKLLPANGPKHQQKLAVGDQEGDLHLLQAKRDGNSLTFDVAFRVDINSKVQSVQLGGAPQTVPDKIFVALDNKVCAFNKKGKLFLSFDTNLTESIKLMFVNGPDLMVCGNHVYNHYRDCKDVGSYLCGDLIVDMCALCPNNTNRIITVLACSGRVLRLLEHSRVRQTIELDSVPTVLHIPHGSLGDKVVCGFSDGRVILFKFDHYSTKVTQEVVVDDPKRNSAVTCLDSLDIVSDGKAELILGRRDGTVQIFTMRTESDFEEVEPQEIYYNNFNESISNIQSGCFSVNGFYEVLVCTYSGKIFGLTTHNSILNLVKSNTVPETLSSDTVEKIAQISHPNNSASSIEDDHSLPLTQVDPKPISPSREITFASTDFTELARFQEVAPSNLTSSMLEVNDSMSLSKVDSTYDLSIEIGMPMDKVIFESDIPVELMTKDEDEKTTLAFETPNPVEGTLLLATFSFNKPNTNRLDARIRTIEGQHGTVEVYIRPTLLHSNFIQTRKYFIKPLSLHIRCHGLKPNLPLNILSLKGGFSLAEIHNWVQLCVPELPEKLPPFESCEFFFENVFVGTSLKCEYRKGSATFSSDNVSTIAILMDVLTKEITKKRIKLDINSDINPNSIPLIIRNLEPKLISHMNLLKDHDILKCLLDLDITEEETYMLIDRYRELLSKKESILTDYENDKIIMNRIFGIVTDLYVDWYKLKGIDVKNKIPDLISKLENYSFNDLMAFFGIEIEH